MRELRLCLITKHRTRVGKGYIVAMSVSANPDIWYSGFADDERGGYLDPILNEEYNEYKYPSDMAYTYQPDHDERGVANKRAKILVRYEGDL